MLMGCVKHQALVAVASEVYILASIAGAGDTKRTLKRNFSWQFTTDRSNSHKLASKSFVISLPSLLPLDAL